MDNGACSASNCITFSSNKAICSICSTGYLLGVNGICVIGKCQTPSSDNSNCLQCLPGYTKQVINQIQLCTLLNCVTVNTMTLTCSQCNTGYTMSNDINGICTIKNCLTYDQVTYACTDCVDQFVLASNICTTCDTLTQIYCAGKCVQLLPGCATMTCANYCLTCLPLYVSNGKGNCNPLIIPNCITYNPLKNLCASCDTSTYLTLDGTCSPLPFCCLAMSGTTCISCRDECYLSTISICTANPPNCSKATPMGKCTNCIHPFSLQNGFCVTLVANCLSYNQNGCNSCSLYYYLDPISLLCIHYPQGCLTFDPVHLVCLSCSSLYTYNPTSSTCTPKSNNIPGCLSYDADLNCLECGYRYYLSKYTCLTYPDYCVNVDIMGNCLSCAFGSKMADNVCVGTTTR